MKVIININKSIDLYTYGVALEDNPSKATFYDSNVLTISNSNSYYFFIKNKSTGTIEYRERKYINCVGNILICNINTVNIIPLYKCAVYTLSPTLIGSANKNCNIGIVPIKILTNCNIIEAPIWHSA
jgi:hypothetical protein